MSTKQEAWGSRVGLVLAMAGNAVGLGNFLRFPVQAIENGGGTFIIPYLVCFLLMGLPLLFIEWSMGRFGGRHGHHSTPFILDTMDKRKLWKYLGVFGLFTNIAVAAYYCYIESWALSYAVKSLMGVFAGMSQADVATHFEQYVGLGTTMPIVFWILCLALNTWVLSRGLSGGIEMVAKFAMPLLILFGVLLAIQGLSLTAGDKGAINDGWVGLNWLWEPDFSSIWSAKVWLAAAGQIFFTLSVGMGTIQCYASYLRSKDDIALNAMSAGWMNEFVEVVLGAAVVIPICVGYFGIDDMKQIVADGGGFGLAFQTLPYLFNHWGETLSIIAGFSWFGLLFFAGITSSLAMGTPFMGFLQDEFGFNKIKASISFGLFILILGAPAVIFYNEGVFAEFDYWAGTVSLVVFAVAEIVLFSWVFGMDRGWKEITDGADIKVPIIFRFIIKWVTPFILLAVFIGSLESIWNAITFKAETGYLANADNKPYIILGRIILMGVYLGLSFLVWVAYSKRKKDGRVT
jgi:neurotransmitter:Na+ symporter, NSS family